MSPAISFLASASDAVSCAALARAESRSLVRSATEVPALPERFLDGVERRWLSGGVRSRARLTVASPSANRARPSSSSAIALLAPSRAASASARARRSSDSAVTMRRCASLRVEHSVPDEAAGGRDQRHHHDARSPIVSRRSRATRPWMSGAGTINSLIAAMVARREGRCRSVPHRRGGASRSGRRGRRLARVGPSGSGPRVRNSTRLQAAPALEEGTRKWPGRSRRPRGRRWLPLRVRDAEQAAAEKAQGRTVPVAMRQGDEPAAGPAECSRHTVEAGRFAARRSAKEKGLWRRTLPGHDPPFSRKSARLPSTIDDSLPPADVATQRLGLVDHQNATRNADQQCGSDDARQ